VGIISGSNSKEYTDKTEIIVGLRIYILTAGLKRTLSGISLRSMASMAARYLYMGDDIPDFEVMKMARCSGMSG
jgi:3-deoxy-D-manno-octulosonate 8-phosphate phosphatase KdsC-like HAD superfamily phosphatase